MAAAFEVTIINKKKIPLKLILRYLSDKFLLEVIETIDDWKWTNHKILELNQIEILDELIEEKIILLYGDFNENKSGIFLYKDNVNYCYDLWISTDQIHYLAKKFITENNRYVYDAILQEVIDNIVNDDLVCCAMGIEISISDEGNINQIVKSSYNVFRWVLSVDIDLDLANYTKERVKSYNVYSRYN